LNQALSRDSGNYDALLLKGRLLLAQGQATQAIAEFGRMTTAYERSPQVHYQLALAHLLNNDDVKALTSVNRAVTLDPNFAEAILVQARLNLRKGDPAAAVPALTRLVNQQPQIAQAHLQLANAYLAEKSPADALGVYGQMMKLFPKNPQIPLFMGMVLVQQKKLADARQAFEKSLELSPDFLPALEQIINLDLAGKQYASALGRAQKQIEKDAKATLPRLLLAKIYLARAADLVQQDNEKSPGAVKRKQLADVPAAQGDVTQAEKALQHAIELEPGLASAYLMLAQVYVAANQHQQALDRLATLLARTNDVNSQVTALMQVGVIQEALKNFPAARAAYEKLLAANPRFTPALNNLAYLYSEHFNQLDKAAQLAEQAQRLYPADPSVADTLGWVYYRKADYPRALSLVTQAAATAPNEPEIQCHLGMIRYALGQEAPARLALQHALEGDKDFPGKDEARRRLATLAIDPKSSAPAIQSLLEKRVAEDPNDPIALVRLAGLFIRNGAPDKAIKAYQQALTQNPKNAYVLTSLAQLFSAPGALNNPQKAMEYAKDAHAAAPDDVSITQLLGHLACQAGDYKWASSLLQDAALKLPDQPALLYDLARSYYGLGQLPAAETALQNALKGAAAFDQAGEAKRLLSMLVAYRDPAQRPAAAPQLKANPNYIPALMVNELLQQEKGNFQDALTTLNHVLALNPLFAPATRDLAILCFDRFPEDPRTSDLATKARDTFPNDPNLAKVLGVVAYRRANYSAAAQYLKQSLPTRKNDGELLYYLGMAQYQLKAKAESKATLQQALALNIQAKLAGEAKRVLAELK
jgi:tetratricopeptide (TPR) repeat protein